MSHKTKTYDNTSPQEVDCPLRIQKRMRANLAAAAKAKVNINRASIAQAILETAKVKQPAQMPTAVVTNDSPKPMVPVVQAVQPEIRTARPKLWNRVKDGFGSLARHIPALLPVKRLPRLANHKG